MFQINEGIFLHIDVVVDNAFHFCPLFYSRSIFTFYICFSHFSLIYLYLSISHSKREVISLVEMNGFSVYCGGSSFVSTGLGDRNFRTYFGKCVFSCAFNMVDLENVLPHIPQRNGRSPARIPMPIDYLFSVLHLVLFVFFFN